ncbi:MAG TPA: MG2 domain-containing protein [Planctomycetota bacterium]
MKLRVALLYGFLAVSLMGTLGAVGYAFPAQDRAGGALPQDEEKLLQYAQERLNHGDWIQAEKAYKAWIEKFPDGKNAEQAYAQLANLYQWYSRKPAEARAWLGKACEKWPKSPSYWNWRVQIAQSWANQELKDKAIEEFRKIAKEAPDAQVRGNALRQIWGVQGKHLQLYVNQTFSAGQQPAVQVHISGINKVAYRATHIPWAGLLDVLGGKDRKNLHESIDKLPASARKLLKEWTVDYAVEKNRGWRSETIQIPSTEPGVYLLEGEHEGVTMTVTLFVSRNGLITKAAAGKLLAFVQDRSTSKPVEGALIRVLHGDAALEGTTDAQGLFATDAFKGGTVVAIKDGDVATTESHWSGNDGERPLVHVTTDRPIYRPNQTVFFRIVHRMERGEKLLVREGEKRVVEIRDAKGNKIYEKIHAFNAFGSAEGEITLGDEPPLGEYKIFLREEKADPNTYQHSWRWYGSWGTAPRDFGQFRVDEYRKPEYKVDVEFKKSPVLQGESVEASILAKYYFGSPVVDAEVKYQVFRRHHYYYWRCWDYYYDWYTEDGDDDVYEGKRGRRGGRAYWGHGEQVHQGTGRTDKDGKLQVTFDAPKWDHDAVYTVAAQVTDLSRRTVDGSATVKATRAEFGLAMTLNKYVYKPGEKINARVRAATPDDKVLAQVPIKVKAYDRRWRENKYDDEFLFQGESTTDVHGIAEFDLVPRRDGGYLWIVAEAEDRKGNKVTTEHWAWLCGANWSGDTVNLNGVDLILDKKTYDIGDTAQALVTSQFRNVTLLFTVEGKEIFHHEVVAVKGHTRLIEFKIDKAAYAPNVFLDVVAIKENAVVQKRKMIVVNPSARFVKVEIAPDKTQYRPRNKAVYNVTTTGADGRPVAAEVSLGVVDESIYALQDEYAWDIRKHFIHRRGNEVGTATSLQYWDYGRADEAKQEKAGALRSAAAPPAPAAAFGGERRKEAADRDGGGGAALAATEVRSKFADTMIWKTVTTGADGRATVEVEIPDNLTTWRATGRASTSDSRFGQSSNDVLVRKEMIVRLEAPRFFTQNDEVIFSAIAHNYMAEAKDVHIEMTAEGLDVQGELKKVVRVASQGQERIDWKAKVRTAGAAVLTVKALATGDSDAMKLTVPVLAHGAMRWESKGGIVEGKVVEKVTIPDGPAREAAELVVVLSPTHAAMVLDALEYLAGYPYGCVEQTMSRFLPTVVVSQALQKLGIEKKELQAELPNMVSAGLQRLYNFQQQDGGWGWWQNDKSNPWTTAYVVMGLAMAKNADHYVEPHVLARGMQALQAHLAAAKEADLQAYCLYSLSVAGLKMDVVRDQLTDKLAELRPYSKALLALTLSKDGRSAKEVVAALAKEAMTVGAAAHFEGQAERGGWMDHSMEVTAACLRAFLAVEPKHELVPRMVHWLATVRQGNYWGSTKQTALVVFAMAEYLAVSGDLNPDMTLSLTVNGQKVLSERVTKENWHAFEGMRKFKGVQLRPGENEIVIERTGNGTPVWSIYAKSYAEGEDLPASKGGIQVERTYARVINDAGKRILQKLESGATVTSGDEIEVTITVSADRDHEWLMMDCPMPSGFEAVREYWGHPGWGRWGYWYSRKEFRDEKVSVAMTTLHRGTHSVQYVMRAEAPGDVHILPAGVFNMYHPQIGGNSSEFRLKVKDRN